MRDNSQLNREGYIQPFSPNQETSPVAPAPHPMESHLPTTQPPSYYSLHDDLTEKASPPTAAAPSINDQNNGKRTGGAFSEKSTRRGFIQKVYGILSIHLVIITSIVAVFSFHEDSVKCFALQNKIYINLAYAFTVILIVILFCWEGRSIRRAPRSFILLGFFTLMSGLMFGVGSVRYEQGTTLLGAIITTIVTFGITTFAFFPKKVDFTAFRGTLLSLLMVTVIFPIVYWGLRPLHFFTIIGTTVPCIFGFLFPSSMIWNIHWMMKRNEYSPEDYVYAALNISCSWLCSSFVSFVY